MDRCTYPGNGLHREVSVHITRFFTVRKENPAREDVKRIRSRRMRLSFTELSRKLKILRDDDIMFLTLCSPSLPLSLSFSLLLFSSFFRQRRRMLVIVVGECKSRRATPLARKLTRKKRLHRENKNGEGKIGGRSGNDERKREREEMRKRRDGIGARSKGSLIEITVNHGSTRVQKRKSREQAVPSTPE